MIGDVDKVSEWVIPVINCTAFFDSHLFSVMFCVGIQAHNILMSSRLLYAYTVISPYVKPLAMMMRKWAKVRAY